MIESVIRAFLFNGQHTFVNPAYKDEIADWGCSKTKHCKESYLRVLRKMAESGKIQTIKGSGRYFV